MRFGRPAHVCANCVTWWSSVYGPNNRAAFSFLKMTEGMERLCQDLQAQVSQDYRGQDVDDLYL